MSTPPLVVYCNQSAILVSLSLHVHFKSSLGCLQQQPLNESLTGF